MQERRQRKRASRRVVGCEAGQGISRAIAERHARATSRVNYSSISLLAWRRRLTPSEDVEAFSWGVFIEFDGGVRNEGSDASACARRSASETGCAQGMLHRAWTSAALSRR